jgi:hypothetical protein
MTTTRIATAVASIALLVAAGPAAAKQKTYHYSGKTDSGDSMSFDLKGKRISNIHGYVPTTCVPTHGTPVSRSGEFNPPGSFKLGTTRKTSETHRIDWWGDTTFNHEVSSFKKKGKTYVVKLKLNFSYIQYLLPGGGQVDQIPYICQGSDSFTFKTP